MARKKFRTVKDYLEDKWEDVETLKQVAIRLTGECNPDWLAGWLTAHVTMDSNCIDFSSVEVGGFYTSTIALACREFAKRVSKK